MKNKQELMDALKQNNVGSVVVTYDGSGDDGQITEVQAYGSCDITKVKKKLGSKPELKKINIDGIKIKWTSKKGAFSKGTWIEKEKTEDMELEEIIRDFCYEVLEKAGFDWVNNDGGYGEITIDPDTGKVSLEHNQRITTVETHSEEF
jgi:hypothetical protein